MSTYDDRLVALEQRVTALSHNLVSTQSDIFTHFAGFNRTVSTLNSMISEQEMDTRDLHHNTGILLGVMNSQGQDIKSMKDDLGVVKADLGTVKADVDSIKADLGAVKEDLSAVKVSIKEDIAAMETRMLDGFKQILTVIDSRLPPAS